MAFTTITKPSVGDATKKTAFADAVIDNLNDLNSRMGAGGAAGISNPSFENDLDADTDPDGWTVTDTGGTHTLPTTDGAQAHGAAAINFAYPASASGGGYFETEDFYECAPGEILGIAWKMLGTSATGAKHIVRVYWYEFDQTACSTASVDAYSDTFNPTAWTQCYTQAQAPTGAGNNACYFKIRIVASDTSATPSGTGNISFDDVRIEANPANVFRNVAEFNVADTSKFINVTAGLLWVEAIGSGAGGHGTAGGSGGGGEYAAGYFAAAATTSYAVTVGAGGAAQNSGNASTFNSTTVVANGGTYAAPGQGGSGGTGVITIDGGDAETGDAYGGNAARGGGGSSGAGTASAPGGGAGEVGTAAGAAGMVRIWFNS